ncbi:Asp-tRNA(Asn)/Glu-tRNA(Gln) amidotransferase subunit GatC [Candidatus Halobeggiatoa sp. HSG11]|nr:Asp-tRNA(Asn)/Glu-tRNA(Gln) amidotransferase subunit GatC [Candidatus Halobeggiatoa sp. HSG11]
MSLPKEEVEKIANLAKIALTESEISMYTKQLSDILDFVEQMNTVDTTDIIPMAHPLDATARLREDVVSESDQRDHFQNIAPQIENGLYLVPQVIE